LRLEHVHTILDRNFVVAQEFVAKMCTKDDATPWAARWTNELALKWDETDPRTAP
jgi:hypothetical protein